MGATTNNKSIASQAGFLQVQAMTALRQKLSTVVGTCEKLTFEEFLKLVSTETALDDTATARIHLKSLRTSQGDITMLNFWSRGNLLATDC